MGPELHCGDGARAQPFPRDLGGEMRTRWIPCSVPGPHAASTLEAALGPRAVRSMTFTLQTAGTPMCGTSVTVEASEVLIWRQLLLQTSPFIYKK